MHETLKLLGVDAQVRQILPEAWKIIEPKLPEILDGFYALAGSVPELAKLVGDQTPRLKKAQENHWRRLFSGQFDEAYFQGVRAIGMAHQKIGLEPRYYIGGYQFVLAHLIGHVLEAYRWSPAKQKATARAVNAAVLLDMDIAISVYQDALVKEREARGGKLSHLLVDFDADVKGTLSTISSAGQSLQAISRSMSEAASGARSQSASVAAASEQASVNIQGVAASAEQLSRSVAEILHQTAQASSAASGAVDEANGAAAVVEDLIENAGKISAIVNLIHDIAGQTNLLALNATIEAARAGEAGKGFAVVASEVKSLASQTARATEEITAAIAEIQNATKNAGRAIHSINARIEELNRNVAAISGQVEQQGEATQEIARNVHEAAAGAHDVAMNIVGVSHAAAETGHAAQEVLGASDALSRQSTALSDKVETFLRLARAV